MAVAQFTIKDVLFMAHDWLMMYWLSLEEFEGVMNSKLWWLQVQELDR